MGIKVEKINESLIVKLPPEYKKPWWSDTMYHGRYTELEDGSIVFPCRDCNVTITKPIMQQTQFGMMQTKQSYVEKWVYFDVPQLSLLVKEGEDLLDVWSIDDLKIELKETQQLEGVKKDEDTNLS